ncbi:MAG: sulfurtransferase [Chloroflexi bacterium]|nr:sulfurtransferase [Chloroflexota bacterium]
MTPWPGAGLARSTRWLASLLVVLGLAAACNGGPSLPAGEVATQASQAPAYARAELLTEPDWLAANLGNDGLVVLDVRSSVSYRQGHIPGAVNLDPLALNSDGPVRGMVGPSEQVQRVLEPLGIGDASRVVIYDDDRGMWAARIFWVLDYYGKADVSLLNGGFARWQREGRSLSTDVPETKTASLALAPNQDHIADKSYVLAALKDKGVALLDVRAPKEYTGATALSERGGHIPGAVNVPWEQALDEEGTFKSQSELRAMYLAVGASPDKEVVTYCQTGVRGAHGYFVLRLIGYDKVRLYDGSWEEWGNDPSLPVER